MQKIFRKNLKLLPNNPILEIPPTLIFKRSKTIGSVIFNYKKVVENVITNNYQPDSRNFPSCDCKSSAFTDPNHGHIVTNNLKIIECNHLRSLLMKGPKYREPQNVYWDSFLKHFKNDFTMYLENRISEINIKQIDFKSCEDFYNKVLEDINSSIEKIKKRKRFFRKMRLTMPNVKETLKTLHEKFVFVPTDKAGNNIAVICKTFYITQSMKELGCFGNGNTLDVKNRTYKEIKDPVKKIIDRHIKYGTCKLKCDSIPDSLPYLYWIPKMHKKPITKQRYIAASGSCTTKPISQMLTKVLSLIDKNLKIYSSRIFRKCGVNPYWIISNSTEVFKCASKYNQKLNCKNMRTYDFSTLYTKIPHKLLKQNFTWIINKAFEVSKKGFISVYAQCAKWTNFPGKNTVFFNKGQLIRILHWLIDNIYVTFGDKIFQQKIGIPMGTDCAPFLANLFLFALECKWVEKMLKKGKYHLLNKFKACCRYIDDLLLLNNDETMKRVMFQIYPSELILIPDDSDGNATHFLDLLLKIVDGFLSSSVYDKRDVFSFPVVNFPFLCGNIPNRSSYGVFIGELVRYARACTFIDDFKCKTKNTICKLLKQNFTIKMLKRSWYKFCRRHILLIQKYGSSILSFHEEWS